MNGPFVTRIAAAAHAAWWTLLIALIWYTLGYLFWLVILHYRPDWVMLLWGGGDLTWSEMQRMALWMFGAFKVVFAVILFAAIWLSLWSRALKRAA
jgi:hypothetical protein